MAISRVISSRVLPKLADTFTSLNLGFGLVASPTLMALGQASRLGDTPEESKKNGNSAAMMAMTCAALADFFDGPCARRWGKPVPIGNTSPLFQKVGRFFGSDTAGGAKDDIADACAYGGGTGLNIFITATAAGHPLLGAVAGLAHAGSAVYRLHDFSIYQKERIHNFKGMPTTITAPMVLGLITLFQNADNPTLSEYGPILAGVIGATTMFPFKAIDRPKMAGIMRCFFRGGLRGQATVIGRLLLPTAAALWAFPPKDTEDGIAKTAAGLGLSYAFLSPGLYPRILRMLPKAAA